MSEIINTFHIDWKIIIAQLVNFAVVVGVLWYFAFKPLAKMMQERTAKIEQGLKNAEEAERRLQETESAYQHRILEAKKEAAALIEAAREAAGRQRSEVLEKTKIETARVVAEAKQRLVVERESMVAEAQEAIADLVVVATEKVIEEKLTERADHELVMRAVKGVKQ